MTTPAEQATIADTLDIAKIIRSKVKTIENNTKLKPVFLDKKGYLYNSISTRSLCLDAILGGGIPCGRTVGVVGHEHTGKSLLATEIAASALESGLMVVYFDGEGGNDPLFLKSRGIDLEKYRGRRNKNGDLLPGEVDTLLYYSPETGEQIRNYMWYIMTALPENRNASKPPVLFILDSVMSLVTDAINGDLDANKMAMHARMYSEIMPIIGPQLSRTSCTFIYVNQMRLKPGVKYGSPDYEPAGEALKFWSSVRVTMDRQKPKADDKEHPFIEDKALVKSVPKAGGVWEEPHDEDGGMDRYVYTAVKTIKNKVYNPFQVAWIRINFDNNGGTGYGLDPVFDVFTFLLEKKAIIKAAPNKSLKEKREDVLGMYEFTEESLVKPEETGLERRFNYWQLKKTVLANSEAIKSVIRKRYIQQLAVKPTEDIPEDEGGGNDGDQDTAAEVV